MAGFLTSFWVVPIVSLLLQFLTISLDSDQAVVLAQLVERSPPTPEIRDSNPIIRKIVSTKLSTNFIIEKTKIKNNGREWPIFSKKVLPSLNEPEFQVSSTTSTW